MRWGGGGSVLIALVGGGEAVGGRAEDFRSYPRVGLSADFWLTRGIDDVTVQNSADSVPPYPHTVNYLSTA